MVEAASPAGDSPESVRVIRRRRTSSLLLDNSTHDNIPDEHARFSSSSSWWWCCACPTRGTATHSSRIRLILYGQVLSFLLACTGAAQATLHLDCGMSAPTFSIGLFYFGLAIFWLIFPFGCCNDTIVAEKNNQGNDNNNSGGMSPHTRRSTTYSPVAAHDGLEEEEEEEEEEEYNKQIELPQLQNTSSALPVVAEVVLSTPQKRFANNNNKNTAPHSFLTIPLQGSPWVYFFMAVLDVYANYFTVLAFKYTTITSVTLFDALAIPSAMVFSRLCLARQYTVIHCCAVLVCMVGVVFNVAQDFRQDTGTLLVEEYPHKLYGDVLSIVGGVLFGANNVLGEWAVRKLGGPDEYIGMLGFFATIICAIQTALLERDEIFDFFGKDAESDVTCSKATARWLLLAFCAANMLNYLGAARFLQISEAAFFNLSLLTGDLWSVLFSVVAERIIPRPLFFVALFLTVMGVLVYEMAPTPVLEDRQQQELQREESEPLSLELQVRDGSGALT